MSKLAAFNCPPTERRPNGGKRAAATAANDEILVVVMIEHVEAVTNAEAIITTPGIDAVFIGPNDLLNSLGRMPAFESEHTEFVVAVNRVRELCQQHRVPVGIHVISPAAAKQRAAEGFQFIALGSDAGFMLGKAHEVTSALGLAKSTGATAKY